MSSDLRIVEPSQQHRSRTTDPAVLRIARHNGWVVSPTVNQHTGTLQYLEIQPNESGDHSHFYDPFRAYDCPNRDEREIAKITLTPIGSTAKHSNKKYWDPEVPSSTRGLEWIAVKMELTYEDLPASTTASAKKSVQLLQGAGQSSSAKG